MLDPKYIPLFIGGFIAWICFMIFVGWITSRGKNEGSSFLTGGGNLGFFLIFCTVGATMIGTGSSMGAIGNGFNHGWGGAIYGLGASAGILSMLLFTKAKNKGFLTMSEEAQYYYGGKKIIRQVMGFMTVSYTHLDVYKRQVQHSGKVLNAHGVLADEVGLHLLDTGQNGGAVAFQHGLAPAGQALVGHDLNKAPAGTDGIGVDFNDLHGKSSFLLYCRRFQWVQVQRWIWSTMPRT